MRYRNFPPLALDISPRRVSPCAIGHRGEDVLGEAPGVARETGAIPRKFQSSGQAHGPPAPPPSPLQIVKRTRERLIGSTITRVSGNATTNVAYFQSDPAFAAQSRFLRRISPAQSRPPPPGFRRRQALADKLADKLAGQCCAATRLAVSRRFRPERSRAGADSRNAFGRAGQLASGAKTGFGSGAMIHKRYCALMAGESVLPNCPSQPK
jgi:hypothetical protein